MAQINQVGVIAVPGGDIPVKNYGGSDISAKTALKYDTSNAGGTNSPRGVVQTTDDTNAVGVALTTIPAGKTGLMRVLGQGLFVAGGTIHVGNFVMTDSSGHVVAQTAGKYQIGYAVSEAGSGDDVAVQIFPAKNA